MDMLTQFYISLALMAISFGIGFYVGERGMAGVKIDMINTKNEIEKVKNLVTPKTIPQAVTNVTSGTGTKVTDTTTVTTPAG